MGGAKGNLGLLTTRSFPKDNFDRVFITRNITDLHSASDQTYSFPLYTYQRTPLVDETVRVPNFNQETINKIADNLKLQFTTEKENADNTFAPIDLLDYIYAVLYSPSYREKYKEFLKIDFPRVPYPENKNQFWNLVKFGGELRELHLLESEKLKTLITTYPKMGDHKVEKISYEITDERTGIGKVRINKNQYFGKVPQSVWNFSIGGYQPAQKWLKDRKGRELTSDDITRYQEIIKAIWETEKLMEEIDREIDN